jgi:HSP20 family protein
MLPTTRRGRGSAFNALMDMSREMDRLMNPQWTEGRSARWALPAEVVESDEEIRFDIEAPGMRVEHIDITLENNVLTVSGEKKFEYEEGRKESDYRLFERRYGRFQRSFTLPPTVNGAQCQARYENGVLTVRLPKAEESKPRRIQIESSNGGQDVG